LLSPRLFLFNSSCQIILVSSLGGSRPTKNLCPPLSITMLLTLLYTLGAVASALSAPSVSVVIPLVAQLPLIARVDEPFTWSFSKNSFVSPTNGSLEYTTSTLPHWLAFEAGALAFRGTPTAEDEGTQEIAVTAADSSSSASSSFLLSVTSQPPPQLRLAISDQFHADNPSLSSVFMLSPNSALSSEVPTLRIPPMWSFSIGLEGTMFIAEDGLYYDALQADGSPLPPWISFDTKTITFGGFTPGDLTPQTLSLMLHASDRRGFTSSRLPFNLVIAPHELSCTSAMPTVNVTASTPFNVSLSSPADFVGVLVDGKAIHPSNITSLIIDTSPSGSWLKYDSETRTLGGDPPDDLKSGLALPVNLTASFNQTIQTSFSVAVVPSYFSAPSLAPVQAKADLPFEFSLAPYFSNATNNGHDDVNLTAAYGPSTAGNWLSFDPSTARLTGTIPSNAGLLDVKVTFTAYSRITHSTSHASLKVDLSTSQYKKDIENQPGSLALLARRKLILGLSIAFGIVGGMILIGVLLAACRRCARVKDTAMGGKEGMRAWSTRDKRWYGIAAGDVEGRHGSEYERGYGWTEKVGAEAAADSFQPVASTPAARKAYGDIGIRRILNRSFHSIGSVHLSPRSGAVMRKGSFMDRIKQSVRAASDKYTRHLSVRKRPVIGKPSLVSSTRGSGSVEVSPFGGQPDRASPEPLAATPVNPFADADVASFAISAATTFSGSPSSSTGGGSIPTRRADLQTTPREPAMVHFIGTRGGDTRPNSTHSTLSSSNASVRTHAAEAVVYTASRAASVGSGRATSSQSLAGSESAHASDPARIMPFTKSSRVPVPGAGVNAGSENVMTRARIVSQRANVIRGSRGQEVDELSMGAHYVQELGGDARVV
jgi:axial budding pattern protein 2